MRITEGLMEVGDFSFSVVSETRRAIRSALNAAVDALDGFICVFDTEVSQPSLASALYVGPLTYGNGRYGYGGMGLAGLLQDDNSLGKHTTTNVTTAAQSLSDWYDDLLPYAGITKGTVTLTGLNTVAATWHMGTGLREHIDFVTSSAGAVWTLNTEGELSAAAPSTLFGDTPGVIVMPSPTSEAGGALKGVNGQVDGNLRDARQKTTRAIGYGPGTTAAINVETYTNAGTIAYGLDGNARQIDRPIDLPNADRAQLADFTEASAARFIGVRRAFRVTTNTASIRSKVKPGDPVYVHDSDADITGDTAIDFNGESIWPLIVRLQRITWNTHKGQGVWLYQPSTSTWTDLTNALPERDGTDTSAADWTVSTDLAAADLVKSISTDRIKVRRPEHVFKDPDIRINPGGGSGDQMAPDFGTDDVLVWSEEENGHYIETDEEIGGWGDSNGYDADGGNDIDLNEWEMSAEDQKETDRASQELAEYNAAIEAAAEDARIRAEGDGTESDRDNWVIDGPGKGDSDSSGWTIDGLGRNQS